MKKQLTEAEKNTLRKTIKKFQLPDGSIIAYCIVNKDSNSGISSNQRLFLIHGGEKSIRYYSKPPPGIPFTKAEQIIEGKEKVSITQVKNFISQPVKGKSTTVEMSWEKGKDKPIWKFAFASSKMMYEWLAAVEEMKSNKLKLDKIPKQNNNEPILTKKQSQQYNPMPPPSLQYQANNPANQNQSKFGDVASQIKHLRKQNYPKFILNNELSRKNLNSDQQNPNNLRSEYQQPHSSGQQTFFLDNKQEQQQLRRYQQQQQQYNKLQQQQYQQQQQQDKKQQQQQQRDKKQQQRYRKQQQQYQIQQYEKQRFKRQQHERQKYEQQQFHQQQQRQQYQKQQQQYSKSQYQKPKQSYQLSKQIFQQPRTMYQEPQYYAEKQKQISQQKEEFIRQGHDQFKKKKIMSPLGSQQNSLAAYEKHQTSNDGLLRTFKNNSLDNSQAQNNEISRSRSHQLPIHEINETRTMSEQYQFPKNKSYKKSEPQRKMNKINSMAASKKWNQLWCTSNEPLEIHEDFMSETKVKCKQIIDELPFLKSDRKYIPMKYQTPYFTYIQNGIYYNMHYFTEGKNMVEQDKNVDKAPLLFDQQSYEESKREFYNYNFLLLATGNKSIFKVPLCCYYEYKGILIVCKAAIPDNFQKVQPYQYEKKIQTLQESIKIRFIFDSMSLYRHPQEKYFIFYDLQELLPRIPNNIYPPCYFRSQILLQNETMIDDKNSIDQLNSKLINSTLTEFISQIQSLQTWIISRVDLFHQLHKAGISLGCLTDLYELTNFIFFKKIIVSEMVNRIFQQILRSQLNNAFANFPADQFQSLGSQIIDRIILDCAHIMTNQLFSYSSKSESIWRVIVMQIKKRYHVVVSKEDVIPGYLLGAIMESNGINCDFKDKSFQRDNSLFVKEDCISKNIFIEFYVKTRRYDLQAVSTSLERVSDILNTQPTPQNYEDLVTILGLKNLEIPTFCQPIKNEILTYLCNFVPLGEHDDFEHLGLYDPLQYEPHTYFTTKISLLAIKWSIKRKNQELANRIFQLKFEENSFWVGEFNPAITEFYDFYSLYNASVGSNEESIKLAKSSLINIIKLQGTNSLPTADKHYQLGNIFFKVGRKEDALKQYLRTKQILQFHKQTNIPEYGVILLKLSILYLNFGKISDCVGEALQALKVFDSNGGNENDEIETFEILARAYQITRKTGDMLSVGSICVRKFNNTQNMKIFQRMIKIVVLPKFMNINTQDSKKLLKLFTRLEQLDSQISSVEAFSFFHHRAEEEQIIMKKTLTYIDNISELYDDVQRRDLLRSHRSLSNDTRSQAAQMLVYFEAIGSLIGYGFLIGCLRDS